ncbi:MAG: FtsB family cell division protein [Spirochaetota bacterium]
MLIAAIWTGYVVIYGYGGLHHRKKVHSKLSELKEEIKELSEQENVLDWKIQNLKQNGPYMEGVAREMGFKKPRDVIFKVISKGNKKPQK